LTPDTDPAPMHEDKSRAPHVVLDAPSRVLKAKKIIELVGAERFARARRILEVGCGSGVISKTLAELGPPGLEVFAVDVADNRLVHEGYAFTQVTGTTLPFDAGMFDIVITNHVIEHVGDAQAQLHHLEEIRRVLATDGVAYLAVPNTFRLVEPHFKLPFLSWLPTKLADRYVRATGRGTHYDCVPLAHREAIALFDRGGFRSRDLTVEALRTTLALEFPHNAIAGFVRKRVPTSAIALGMAIMPTFVFLLKPKTPAAGTAAAGAGA